jgi:pilus assembly protein Flp/PilA
MFKRHWFSRGGEEQKVYSCSNPKETTMNKFLKDEAGATAIEYGLIAAAMGLALVTAMPSITAAIKTKFASIGGHVSSGT